MGFFRGLLDILTGLLGGSLFVVFAVAAVLCTLSALLALSDENRIAFKMLAKAASIALICFGIVLPLRSISFFGTVLAFFWASILAESIPNFRVYQVAAASVLSLLFWLVQLVHSEAPLPLNIGDFTIFVIIPVGMGLVQLSRGSETLSKQEAGPKVPLHKFLSMLNGLLVSAFPVSR